LPHRGQRTSTPKAVPALGVARDHQNPCLEEQLIAGCVGSAGPWSGTLDVGEWVSPVSADGRDIPFELREG
jgi:hypothetical protein